MTNGDSYCGSGDSEVYRRGEEEYHAGPAWPAGKSLLGLLDALSMRESREGFATACVQVHEAAGILRGYIAPILASSVRDEDALTRANALLALGALGSLAAAHADALVSAAESADADERCRIATAHYMLTGAPNFAVGVVRAAIQEAPRWAAETVLALGSDAASLQSDILRALGEYPEARLWLSGALWAATGSAESVELALREMEEAVQNPAPSRRGAVLRVLETLGPKAARARSILEQLEKDSRFDIAGRAHQILRRLG